MCISIHKHKYKQTQTETKLRLFQKRKHKIVLYSLLSRGNCKKQRNVMEQGKEGRKIHSYRT
jgi:hypothetical protein